MHNPLLDNEFLKQLHEYRQREVYARITRLNQNELPIEYIEGRVTGGSINIDGNSALRRTCNLTMTLKDQEEINQFYWTFENKFKLEIGLKNMIDPNYPEIIWFPQGVFILTSCNMNQTTNNYTITINGKDKMCKLNGDLGGNIFASTDFGTLEEIDEEGNITYVKILLKEIIKELLINFGGELPSNIIINDLDDAGLELLEYRYEQPAYLYRKVSDGTIEALTLNGEAKVKTVGGKVSRLKTLNSYAVLDGLMLNLNDAVQVYLPGSTDGSWNESEKFQIVKYEDGDLAGYRLTDLTYAGELKANVGETIVSVLDKIKNMLGQFEYFYNLDGRFVFQKKKSYINTPWGATEQSESGKEINLITNTSALINLTNAQLVTSFGNNPNLLNVKNDFTVWGTHKSVSGEDIPIHMRYAIDKKPTTYRTFRPIKIVRNSDEAVISEEKTNFEYFYSIRKWVTIDDSVTIDGIEYTYYYLDHEFSTTAKEGEEAWDWRELIYQMALDYYKCRTDEDFYLKMMDKNPWTVPTGRTGYEQYYTDIQGFWRLLYNPNPDMIYEEVAPNLIVNKTPDEAKGEIKEENVLVDDAYISLTEEEIITLRSELKKWQSDSTTELSYKPDDLFVIMENEIGAAPNTTKKKVIYPFIGSKYCCLKTKSNGSSEIYWYSKNGTLTSSGDPSVLNVQPLSSLYQKMDDTNETKRLVIYQRLIEVLDVGATTPTLKTTLYKKSGEQIKLLKLNTNIEAVYKASGSAWTQTIYRWDIKDNYGTLSDSSETAENITYIGEKENSEYVGSANGKYPAYWNKMVFETPEQLLFWFDFLEAEGSDLFDKYSVPAIGDRTKAINDTSVKSIYYRDVPNIIFQQSMAEDRYDTQTGYTYIQISEAYQPLFSISSRGKSAKERIDELLQEHSYCVEQSSITTVPLYHLEPNTKIAIRDDMSKINGEYFINKVTIPLAYNGTMNLTANKVVSTII